MRHSIAFDRGNEHILHPVFEQNFAAIKRHFFSRDPKYWPCFSDPGLAAIIAFRQRYLPPGETLAAYPDGPKLLDVLIRDDVVPRRSTTQDGRPDEILMFAAALSTDWENPASVENVITMPCDPGI